MDSTPSARTVYYGLHVYAITPGVEVGSFEQLDKYGHLISNGTYVGGVTLLDKRLKAVNPKSSRRI